MLLIEKVVKLLDDFHYNVFREHLKHTSLRSYYPMALFDVIDRNEEIEQSTDKLVAAVYGNDEEKDPTKVRKKLLQLASHTFKMTGYLAKNYPDYLQHNVTRIQHLINTGESQKATKLAHIVLEVAQKIEDFDTELKILNILIQREVLLESAKKSQEYHLRTEEILQHKRDLNEVMSLYNKHIRIKGKPGSNIDADLFIDVFKKYYNSKSTAVSLISKYYSYFTYYYLRDRRVFEAETFIGLLELEDQLEKNDYVIFPYLFTLNQRIPYLKLSLKISEWSSEEILEEANKIIDGSKNNLFWNSFPNIPEMLTMGIQLSHYLNNYLVGYKEEELPNEIEEEIERLQKVCENLLTNEELEKRFEIRYITLQYTYAGFLILDDKEKVKKAINILESLLISFQQTPFHKFIDSLFSLLIIAYFISKQYDKLEDAYRRYKKAISGKTANAENDLTINGFFYAAKWIVTERKQYTKKLKGIIDLTREQNLKNTEKMLCEAKDYFKIPV